MSNNSADRARQPEGQPTGGQFAEEAKGSSGLSLGAHPGASREQNVVETGVEFEDLATYEFDDLPGLLGYEDADGQVWLTEESLQRLSDHTRPATAQDNDAPRIFRDMDTGQWVSYWGSTMGQPHLPNAIAEGRGVGNERLFQPAGWDLQTEKDWNEAMVNHKVDLCADSYLHTARLSSNDGERDLDEVDAEFSDEAKAQARQDLTNFLTTYQAPIRAAVASTPGYDITNVAQDYWLTRNGHGGGFWDRGLGDVGDRLTEAAHAEGEVDVELGDDGQFHFL